MKKLAPGSYDATGSHPTLRLGPFVTFKRGGTVELRGVVQTKYWYSFFIYIRQIPWVPMTENPAKNPLFLPPKDSHVTYLSISHPPHHADRLIHTRCSSLELLSFLCVGVFFFWNRTSLDPEKIPKGLFGCVTGAPPVGPSFLKNNRLINSLEIRIIYENPWPGGGIKECK